MLEFLDLFFLIFHTLWTVFNITGWIWKKTRLLHLATTLLTALSWFILGIKYGWGYCPCTDWHWQVREALGRPIQPDSYIQFLIHELTGASLPSEIVDNTVLVVFLVCFALSIALNIRDFRKRRAGQK